MKIYLAGPINKVTVAESTQWRSKLISMCPSGYCFFDPAAAFGASYRSVSGDPSGDSLVWVDHLNYIALYGSDVMVLRLEEGQKAQMTYVEIGMAKAWGVPVIAWGDYPSPFLKRVYDECETSLEEVVERLSCRFNSLLP